MLWRMCPRWRNHSLIPTALWSLPSGRTAPRLEPGEFTPFNSHTRVSPLRYLDEWRDTGTSTEMGTWTLRLYISLLCQKKKKNFKGTIFMSAKPDQMGPKKKADSPDSLPGLRFPVPVIETLSFIQGPSIAIHTHTHTPTHTHARRGHHKQRPWVANRL